jgi:hypothetical protein
MRVLYNGGGLQLIIYACYSWKMLMVGLDVSLDNMKDWKRLLDKAGEVSSAEICITNDGCKNYPIISLCNEYLFLFFIYMTESSQRCSIF